MCAKRKHRLVKINFNVYVTKSLLFFEKQSCAEAEPELHAPPSIKVKKCRTMRLESVETNLYSFKQGARAASGRFIDSATLAMQANGIVMLG